MIRVKDVKFGYGEKGRPIFDGLSFDLADGEYVAVIGPNGSGKTTLLKLLNALLVPAHGSVNVDGLDTREARCAGEVRRRVGMVFQNPDNQIVGMTVEEDTAFGPGNLQLPPEVIRARVEAALATVGLLDKKDRAPHTLSGGEKRLAAVAGVLAMEPRYIAFDEPTSYLDPAARRAVLELMRALHSRGIGIIHISHDMDEIVGADRVIVLAGGSIAMQGAPAEILVQAGALKGMGLEVPRATEFVLRLRESGFPVPARALTIEEACEEILDAAAAPRKAAWSPARGLK